MDVTKKNRDGTEVTERSKSIRIFKFMCFIIKVTKIWKQNK